MIPEDVENRIAKYFFHNYLPDHIMYEILDRLTPQCINEEEINKDALVLEAVLLIQDRLEDNGIK